MAADIASRVHGTNRMASFGVTSQRCTQVLNAVLRIYDTEAIGAKLQACEDGYDEIDEGGRRTDSAISEWKHEARNSTIR